MNNEIFNKYYFHIMYIIYIEYKLKHYKYKLRYVHLQLTFSSIFKCPSKYLVK